MKLQRKRKAAVRAKDKIGWKTFEQRQLKRRLQALKRNLRYKHQNRVQDESRLIEKRICRILKVIEIDDLFFY